MNQDFRTQSKNQEKSVNYLNGKSCYLCGSIADAKDDGVGWRDLVAQRLEKLGVVVDDPTKKTINSEIGKDKAHFKKLMESGDLKKVKDEFWHIIRRDLRSVDRADFLIAYIDPDLKMCGTIHELVVAHHMEKKPILMYVPKEKLKDLNAWFLNFTKIENIFTDWNELFKYLDKVNSGKFNTSYWVL